MSSQNTVRLAEQEKTFVNFGATHIVVNSHATRDVTELEPTMLSPLLPIWRLAIVIGQLLVGSRSRLSRRD